MKETTPTAMPPCFDRWCKKLAAFRTAISYRFVKWLNHNRDVFIAYKAIAVRRKIRTLH